MYCGEQMQRQSTGQDYVKYRHQGKKNRKLEYEYSNAMNAVHEETKNASDYFRIQKIQLVNKYMEKHLI